MANSFDFNKLCTTFTEICPDFAMQTADESQSLDFASKVLFDLGPKLWHIKQSGAAQMWRLIFSGGVSVYIYSYTFKSPMNVNPRLHDKKVYMTLKQAGLLAVSKLCSLMPDHHNPLNKILLTPLARAVFEPKKISKIDSDLTALLGRGVDCSEVVKAVISSCQTDGFHLQHSQCHIAMVAVEVTVTVAVLRQKILAKTQRLYAKHGKNYDAAIYKIYAQHSKIESRAPDAELPPASTSDQGRQSLPRSKSVNSVLRGIVRSFDDPLSGGTLELNSVAPPVPFSQVEVNLPTPIDIQVKSTTLGDIRFLQTNKKLR